MFKAHGVYWRTGWVGLWREVCASGPESAALELAGLRMVSERARRR